MSSLDIPGVLTPTQKALIRAWWRKVTVANPRAGNFQEMKVPVIEKGVFGIPLQESIKYAHSSISYIDSSTGDRLYGVIPTIVAKCGSFLKEEGRTVEGIFRLSGSAKRIGLLQTIFDSGDQYGLQMDWRGYTVHDAANVMRRFLNHLPEPVITLDHYQPFKDTMNQSFTDLESKIDAFQALIQSLPLPHQYLLIYLLDMLGLFALSAEATKMAIPSLASVFVPGMLSHPDDALNPAAYKQSQKVLEFLIEHQERFSMPQSAAQPTLHRQTSSRSGPKYGLTRNTSTSSSIAASSIKDYHLTSSNGSTHSPKLYAADLSYFSGAPQRSSTVYSTPSGAYSISGLSGFISYTPPLSSEAQPLTNARTLRRARTAPSKRHKYGEYESPQIIYVNRNITGRHASHRRWKSSTRPLEQHAEPIMPLTSIGPVGQDPRIE